MTAPKNSGIMKRMKPALPVPHRPDGRPFESLDEIFRAAVAVPKAEIDKREEDWRREHGRPRKPAVKKPR